MLPTLFTSFIKESAVTVMTRSLLERLLNPEQLDQWFEATAQDQYTRKLLFSSVFGLMLEVVCGFRTSVNRAYDAQCESIPVSLTSVYNKLNGIELHTSAELVRYSAQEAELLINEMQAQRPGLLPGYRIRMLDGNCIAASEHRLKVLRGERAGALPGKSLAVFEPALGLITDVYPCEDGHAQERSLLGSVLERVGADEVWVADRNFCTQGFLTGLEDKRAFFVIREHQGLSWNPTDAMRDCGETDTGSVSEQSIRVIDAQNQPRQWRRIRVTLKKLTRDGDDCIYILTNLPASVASGVLIAELYRQRWSIETAFQHLEQNLNSEINTLGHPPAALFGFCTALVVYNVMAVVMAALRTVHGKTEIDERFSAFAMAEEISTTYRGMMIAIPEAEWRCFALLPTEVYTSYLLDMARAVRLRAFLKRKRGPKKVKTKASYDKRKPHVSTAKLLKGA